MTGRHARPRPPEGLSVRVIVAGVAVFVVLVVLAGGVAGHSRWPTPTTPGAKPLARCRGSLIGRAPSPASASRVRVLSQPVHRPTRQWHGGPMGAP